MPITERIQSAGNLVKVIGGVILLFPGVAILLGLVDIPPSLADMVKVIAYSVCAAVLLAVFLMDEPIRRLSNKWAAILGIAAVLLGGACVVGYYSFANRYVVEVDAPAGEESKFIAPRQPSEELLRLVDPVTPGRPTITEYKQAIEGSADNEYLKERMTRESGSTMIFMILLLVLSEVLLIAPVVAIAWKLVSGPPGAPDAAPAPPAPPAGQE